MRIVFGYQPREPRLEVASRRCVRILHDHKRAACVLTKHGHHPLNQPTALKVARHQLGDFVGSLTARADGERCLMHRHKKFRVALPRMPPLAHARSYRASKKKSKLWLRA